MHSLGEILVLHDAPAAQAAGAGGLLSSLPLLLAILAIFYFLMIRPQQKEMKEHQKLLDSLKKGDRVVLASGIRGRVAAVHDDVVRLEVADGVRIEVDKQAVRRRLAPAGDDAPAEKRDKKSRKGA